MEDPKFHPGTFPAEEWLSHSEALRRVALSILGDPGAADDAVQGTWLKAAQNPPRRLTFGWLTRVLRSRALDEARRRSRHAAQDLEEAQVAAQRQPSEIAASLETYRKLSGVVARLPEGQRQVVYLRYYEGKGPVEIAQELDLAPGTVKKRLERALVSLRGEFDQPAERQGLALVALASDGALAAGKRSLVGAWPAALLGGGLMWKGILVALVGVLVCLGLWIRSPEKSLAVVPLPVEGEESGARKGLEATDLLGEPPRSEVAGHRVQDRPQPEKPDPKRPTLHLSVLWSDGLPAEGAMIQMTPAGANQRCVPAGPAVPVGTNGLLIFDELAPGAWRADSNYMGSVEVLLEQGTVHQVVLQHGSGKRVSGTVLDPGGKPVENAAVWLSQGVRKMQDGALVAHTDSRGRYELEHVREFLSIGAFAQGWAPSRLTKLRLLGGGPESLVVDLSLRQGGASVRGRVLDSSGEGLAGAWVLCGGAIGPWFDSGEGLIPGAWSPRTAQTGANGVFELHGLPSGTLALCAQAPESPVWNGTVDAGSREQVEITIRLQSPATLEGVVRDSRGDPLAGAAVHVFDQPLDSRVLSLGALHYNHPLGHPQAQADEQGRYVLSHLRPGEAWVVCLEPGVGLVANSTMRAEAQLVLDNSRANVWDAVIEPGRTIRGRVTYLDGSPVRRAFLEALDESTGAECVVRTDGDGQFEFFNLSGDHYTVSTHLDPAPPEQAELAATGIVPDSQDLLLVATFSPKPIQHGSVLGRIDDRAGRIQGKLDFKLEGPRAYGRIERRIDGSTFEFSKELPGRRRLVVLAGRTQILVTPWFELAPGERVDLGSLATEAGGRLQLDLLRSADVQSAVGRVRIEHVEHAVVRRIPFQSDEAGLALENLLVGDYVAWVEGEGLAETSVTVRVRAGQVALAVLPIESDS